MEAGSRDAPTRTEERYSHTTSLVSTDTCSAYFYYYWGTSKDAVLLACSKSLRQDGTRKGQHEVTRLGRGVTFATQKRSKTACHFSAVVDAWTVDEQSGQFDKRREKKIVDAADSAERFGVENPLLSWILDPGSRAHVCEEKSEGARRKDELRART